MHNPKSIILTIGRYQPPNSGHLCLFQYVANRAQELNWEYGIYATHSQDPKKNPLSYKRKMYWLKRMFPDFNIREDESRNIFELLTKLSKEGYNRVILIVGEDRGEEFKNRISPYLNHPDPEKRLIFDEFKVEVAKHDVAMHSSELRSYVINGYYDNFQHEIGNSLMEPEKYELYEELRESMENTTCRKVKKTST